MGGAWPRVGGPGRFFIRVVRWQRKFLRRKRDAKRPQEGKALAHPRSTIGEIRELGYLFPWEDSPRLRHEARSREKEYLKKGA